MIKKLWMLAAAAIILTLTAFACTQDAPVGEGAGAETGGAADTSGAGGQSLGSGAGGLLSERVVHFAFDSSAIDSESSAIIEAHAEHLKANSDINVRLEGHADERGTREYNLALGERRANAVARMFKALGVSGRRLKTISYGEEKPVDGDHNESAWRQNRRVELNY